MTTFQSLDWPTVATGRRAKFSVMDLPSFGIFARVVVDISNIVRKRVKRGINCTCGAGCGFDTGCRLGVG